MDKQLKSKGCFNIWCDWP